MQQLSLEEMTVGKVWGKEIRKHKTEYQNEWSLFGDFIYTILTQRNYNNIPKHS